MVKWLVEEAGADLTVADGQSKLPGTLAAENHHEDIVEYLHKRAEDEEIRKAARNKKRREKQKKAKAKRAVVLTDEQDDQSEEPSQERKEEESVPVDATDESVQTHNNRNNHQVSARETEDREHVLSRRGVTGRRTVWLINTR